MHDDPPKQGEEAPDESFADILNEFEKSARTAPTAKGKGKGPGKGRGRSRPAASALHGTVVGVSGDFILIDYGAKSEGVIPAADLRGADGNLSVKRGDSFDVAITGYNSEGMATLSRVTGPRPRDWDGLMRAFENKEIIAGRVTASLKGGFSVDVGTRAFMPASRSGVRDAAEMEKLVGQEIRCRIIKLDVTEEDVVVDRRIITEEEERATKDRRYSEIQEGETVRGTVRSLADYGAFVDIGGVDGLLHVAEISWSRVNKPSDLLSVGQEIEARVLKVDPDKRRISLGMKQLLPHPWDAAADKYKQGERVRGSVTRLADFGAFVELEAGVEGLIHVSEMSWSKKVRKPSDAVKVGETVEAVILGVNIPERRISLGVKQALGDPWIEAAKNLTVGSVIEGPIVSITKFGAFVQIAEGVEGMIHVSEISAEKRINHPQDVLKVGQTVKAQVLDVDGAKRNVRLSIKQMVPSSLD